MSKTRQDSEKAEAHPASPPDPMALAQDFVLIADKSRALIQDFLARQAKDPNAPPPASSATLLSLEAVKAWTEAAKALWTDPERLFEAQIDLWQDYIKLGRYAADRMLGKDATPVIAPTTSDKRFLDQAWQESAVFDVIKQSYLLTAHWMQGLVHDAGNLSPKAQQKADFYTRQFVDALSPSNFALTNPEVLRTTLDSGGKNLLRGVEKLLADLEQGGGQLKISMTDPKAFSLGGNIAETPGQVVFQNDFLQLIQYKPLREQVYERPLLVIPPWINKYYILDLGAKKSFVRFALEQGHQVFMVSWVNPDERYAEKDFSDYLKDGALAAMDAVGRITGAKELNAVGYCLGGTLLASTLAWLATGEGRKKEKQEQPACKVASATYFVTLVDFREPGELGVFIDDDYLAGIESSMRERGYLDGSIMATTFNLLRANDLIWSFVVNSYLLGKEPFPFDLLYWNADATRMPAAMHSFYLRKMYQENRLCQKNALELYGRAIDLTKITTPSFIVGTSEDHIAPWRSVYAATQLYKGAIEFVLAGSGHIAGIINPPAAKKYNYQTLPKGKPLPKEPEAWLKEAVAQSGSWWNHWAEWLAPHAGKMVAAKPVAEGIEPAPGSYVRVKA